MFDRLVKRFCEFDDFDKTVCSEWRARLILDDTSRASASSLILVTVRLFI